MCTPAAVPSLDVCACVLQHLPLPALAQHTGFSRNCDVRHADHPDSKIGVYDVESGVGQGLP